ncbi:MAG: hypothetical protein QOF84_2269 [Streptomyces sp.]|nr:hypothetical protein [Streptomyces sp.]
MDILTALMGAVALLVLGTAFAAVTTGRMPMPWLAGQTPRPRLWGLGQLPLGLMVLFQAYARAVHIAPGTRLVLSVIGAGGVVVGVGLSWAGQRARRRKLPTPPFTG